jgi:quercetin dioxygenase-like cupin family protein
MLLTHICIEVYRAQQGDFVFILKGIEHKYQFSSNGGKVLIISSACLEKYFREIADTLSIGPITWK